jgi:hypothetical protein
LPTSSSCSRWGDQPVTLFGVQKPVFAIYDADVYCDKDGIDGLMHRYGAPAMRTFAEAFEATEIAGVLLALTKHGPACQFSSALPFRLEKIK